MNKEFAFFLPGHRWVMLVVISNRFLTFSVYTRFLAVDYCMLDFALLSFLDFPWNTVE